MPGQSKTHRATLEEMGAQWWCEYVAAGGLITPELAKRRIPASVFYRWMAEPQNERLWKNAKIESAHALSERAMQAATSEEDPRMASLAKLRHDAYKWFAKIRSPDEYGDKQQVNVSGQISVGHLHLVAMRDPVALPASASAPAEIEEVEVLPELEVTEVIALPEPEPRLEAEEVIVAAREMTEIQTLEPPTILNEAAAPTVHMNKGAKWGRGGPRKRKQDNSL